MAEGGKECVDLEAVGSSCIHSGRMSVQTQTMVRRYLMAVLPNVYGEYNYFQKGPKYLFERKCRVLQVREEEGEQLATLNL